MCLLFVRKSKTMTPAVFVMSCFCTALWLIATGAVADPGILELNVGEAREVVLPGGRTTVIRLRSYLERTEPFYQSADTQFVDAVVSADVALEVDGVQHTVTGGPFRLPVTVNGVAVLVACTRGWAGGIFADGLTRDVRLEVSDARTPWTEPERFVYPIRNYRWRASNYQHTYLGVVVNQARLYYHRGEDLGMIPDLEQTRAMSDGRLSRVPPPGGDGDSNDLWVEDAGGMTTRYLHMNAAGIDPLLSEGDGVRQGQALGLAGNTYAGHCSPSPHLHVSMHDGDVYRNTFPLFVAAYRHRFPGELLPIAGNVRHLYAGEEITLDGSLSLAGNGAQIESYQWTFTDGGRANAPRVRRRYPQPGVYSEELRVTDNQGRTDRDFVEVFVFSRTLGMRPPRAWINYYPIRGIRPGTEVRFLIRYKNIRDLTIDYGDGTQQPYAEWTTHRYAKPGNYVVSVKGEDAGAGPGTFRVRVIVEAQTPVENYPKGGE